jgi:uncharacterized membrane protein
MSVKRVHQEDKLRKGTVCVSKVLMSLHKDRLGTAMVVGKNSLTLKILKTTKSTLNTNNKEQMLRFKMRTRNRMEATMTMMRTMMMIMMILMMKMMMEMVKITTATTTTTTTTTMIIIIIEVKDTIKLLVAEKSLSTANKIEQVA